MRAELEALDAALGSARRPVLGVVGGSKVSTKLDLLRNLIGKLDQLAIGGGMANTFLAAQGWDVAASFCEHDLTDTARDIIDAAALKECELLLPLDVVVADEVAAGQAAHVRELGDIEAGERILDAGPKTLARLDAAMDAANTLVWNGPLGVFEIPPFDHATVAAARHAAGLTKSRRLIAVAGGGDTVAALKHAGVADDFTFVSTAGGAFLEWLEGRTLPGVAALEALSGRSRPRRQSGRRAMSLGLGRFAYTRGLHDLGNGGYAWLQPDGGWGWSNAGLIVDGDQSLLVDTLFDVPLTRDMLAAMKAAEPKAADRIDMLVNTHHNGDHCFGNSCCEGAEIIAHTLAREAMAHEGPERLARMMELAPQMGEAGAYLSRIFGPFDFKGSPQTLPTTTFETELTRKVGDKTVHILHVGPAHTPGDALVHVPADRVVFTGDILFIEGHPIMWEGPVGNWIAACERILAMDVETVVPGHGPITDKRGVAAVCDYLAYVRDEACKRYEAGLTAFDAARDIDMSDYDSWGDGERIVVNVATLYREFSGSHAVGDVGELFGQMAQLARPHP
jgi:glyoxylase-like metal-dependent hydrolase (beta-lactamase superfamily II)